MNQHSIDADDFEALRIEYLDDVLRITIDHPESELNAVDDQLHSEFSRLFAALKSEEQARAILLTGSGRAFSAGGDFGWFPQLDNLEKLERLRRDAKQLIWDLLDIPAPIIGLLPDDH